MKLHYFQLLTVVVITGLVGVGGCDEDGTVSDIPKDEWSYARVVNDEADLIGGPLAQGQLGDVLIGNSRVRFIIAGFESPRSFTPYGGTVIDADVVRPAGEPGQDHLGELATIAGYVKFMRPESMKIVQSGSGGKSAIVRVTGQDAGMHLVEAILPMDPVNVMVQVDYILEPGADSLIIKSSFTGLPGNSGSVKPGDGLILGDLVTLCTSPEPGCDLDDTPGRPDVVGAYAPGKVSYGYFLVDTDVRIELMVDELWLMMSPSLDLEETGSATFTRYLAVGPGDMESVTHEALRRRGELEPRLISGWVELTNGDPAVGATVDVRNGEGEWVTRALADDSGAYRIRVAPGSYELVAGLPVRTPTAPQAVDVAVGDATATLLTLDEPARVVVDVRDAAGDPVPARVKFLAGTDPSPGAGATLVIYSKDGGGEGVLPPGSYVAAVTRGYEYDTDWVPLEAVAGETVTVSALLSHVVDTSGYLALDTHTHTRYSIDSQLSPEDRVAQAAAEQVEVVVTTEHDYISDLAPVIEAEGAGDHLISARGVELSPLNAHMNAYPVSTQNAQRQGYWPVAWWETDADGTVTGMRTPAAIFTDARDDLGAQIIQLNHPRDDQALLTTVGYDPLVGMDGVDEDTFDTNWNAIEICNSGWGSDDLEALQDWYSFLNQGLPIVAVGVSDSHGLSTMLGIARTLVAAPDDVVSPSLDLQPVWDNLLAQRATVVVGPFVLLWALPDSGDPASMGGQVTRSQGPVQLRVQIQAAPFVQTSRLIIVANGDPVAEIALPDPGDPPAVVRYDQVVDIDWTGGDAWFVAVVEGDTPMLPLTNETPRSVTNPVYVDRDGDGAWTPPGL